MTYEEAKEIFETLEVQVPLGCRRDFQIARELAIKDIEKQIPKKVEWTEDYTWGVHTPQPVCPACDYYLITTHFIGDGKGKEISYCGHCGQAIDWSSEDGR